MAWQFTEALDEVETGYGPNLLTGDYQAQNPGWALTGSVWTGTGHLALHEGDPYTGPITASDTTHVVTADVMASSEVTVTWAVYLDTSDGDVTLGPWSETIPAGAWVTVWQEYRTPPGTLGGSPALTATGPVQVRAPRASLVTGQTVVRQVVAGDPDGARVVLAGDALTAYDQTGTETARIAGEGGEFVGGSFRTSDNLPGRVRIADDAFTYSGRTLPGIEIIPEDTQSTVRPAGIGPWGAGAALDGGEDSSGRSAKLHATPTQAGITSTSPTGDAHMYADSSGISMRGTRASDGDSGHISVDYTGANLTATDGESGEYGRLLARPGELRMTLRDGSGNATGDVRVVAGTTSVSAIAPDGRKAEVAAGASTGARVGYTNASGVYRRIEVTPSGFYLVTNVTGSAVRTNLETLVSDVESLKARVAALEG